MKLPENIMYELVENIRSVCGVRAFIADLSFKILVPRHDAESEGIQRELDRYSAPDAANIAALPRGDLTVYKYVFDGSPLCIFIIKNANARFIISYMKTLADILLRGSKRQAYDNSVNTRDILINQISGTNAESREFSALIEDFGYSRVCRRCAVLFEITRLRSGDENNFDFSPPPFESLINESPHSLSGEDIYGFLTSKRYMVYKDVSSIKENEMTEYIQDYARIILRAMADVAGYECRVGIGSVYHNIFDLRNSYLEASFLLSNFEYLNNAAGNRVLHIDGFIFEYLSEVAGLDNWRTRFRSIDEALPDGSGMLRAAIELSRNGINTTRAAEKCGVHRNTMIQRFTRLKAAAGIDPANSDRDRMLLRAFALNRNKKVTLSVGIVIQPNSILHLGMQKLAEIIERESNGSIDMDIHTLSVSGNNAMLFETARMGTLDMVVAATGVMNKFTDGLTALIDFPFLFETNEEAMYVLNSAFLSGIEDPLKDTGIKCLNIWSMGWRYITSRTPIRLPSDIVGQKIRIMSTESIYEYFKSIGAVPIHIPYGKVREALRAGIIDCEENPYHNILGMRFYEEQRYITRLKYYLDTEGLYMCQKTWDCLSQTNRELLKRAAKEATEWIFREQHYVINQQAKSALVSEHQMEILEISGEQKDMWKKYADFLYASYPHRSFLQKIMEVRNDFRH